MKLNHLTDYLLTLLIVILIAAAGVRYVYQSALVGLTSGSISRATSENLLR